MKLKKIINSIKASLRDRVLTVLLNILSKKSSEKKRIIIKCNGNCFLMVSLFIRIGLIRADTPIINIVLTIVEPTTLAMTISLLPFMRLLKEINSSGVLVPKATILREIINLGILILADVEAIPSTNKSAPLINRKKPIIVKTMYFIIIFGTSYYKNDIKNFVLLQ